jgi:anti-anti-sigma factor
MSDIRTPPPGEKQLPGTVEVEHHSPGLAVVSVHGEHDLCTTPELTQALEQAAMHSNVLIDLSDCSFIDSSVIQALVKTALALEARGEQLALVIPPEQRMVARVARMTRLSEILPIYASRGVGLARLQPEQ